MLSDDFLIILLSHDEISAFLLSVIVRNSSLLTGVLICLCRSLSLWLRNLQGHVYLAYAKIKRNGNTCLLFAEQIYRYTCLRTGYLLFYVSNTYTVSKWSFCWETVTQLKIKADSILTTTSNATVAEIYIYITFVQKLSGFTGLFFGGGGGGARLLT